MKNFYICKQIAMLFMFLLPKSGIDYDLEITEYQWNQIELLI